MITVTSIRIQTPIKKLDVKVILYSNLNIQNKLNHLMNKKWNVIYKINPYLQAYQEEIKLIKKEK